jgi:hypothetical protein
MRKAFLAFLLATLTQQSCAGPAAKYPEAALSVISPTKPALNQAQSRAINSVAALNQDRYRAASNEGINHDWMLMVA